MIILFLLAALAGWVVGVAINHAADLLPERTPLRQWPRCSACGARRPWPAWSVLLTYLSGQTACRQCGQGRAKLTRSLGVEVVTPLLFVFLLGRYGPSWYAGLVSLYTTILILVTVTDLEHRLILNDVMLPAILLAVGFAFVTPDLPWKVALLGGAVGFVLVYLAALVARGGLGGGDVTLSAFLGLMLFGVFLGGLVAFLLLITRRVGLKSMIPYGPFLTITGWIMLVWGDEIWRYYF